MKFARMELLFVIAAVAVVVTYFHDAPVSTQQPQQQQQQAPVTTPGASQRGKLISEGQAVPAFSLPAPGGQEVVYDQGQGPILVVLTATGCSGCVQRIGAADVQAYQLAQEKNVPVWNMLVYQGPEGAADFVAQHRPSADLVVCDRDAGISVSTLGGSDATCWLLIDADGKLAWRGPAEPEALAKALENL